VEETSLLPAIGRFWSNVGVFPLDNKIIPKRKFFRSLKKNPKKIFSEKTFLKLVNENEQRFLLKISLNKIPRV